MNRNYIISIFNNIISEPNSGTTIVQRLVLYLCNYKAKIPQSLLHLARNAIRKSTKCRMSDLMKQNIPKELKHFIIDNLKPNYKRALFEFF